MNGIDAFISYRRSNGCSLASLLKVHLQQRGYRVFLDIERLRAGRFDEKILDSIKKADNFILVLTPDALKRCKDDELLNDWVHRVSDSFRLISPSESTLHDCYPCQIDITLNSINLSKQVTFLKKIVLRIWRN